MNKNKVVLLLVILGLFFVDNNAKAQEDNIAINGEVVDQFTKEVLDNVLVSVTRNGVPFKEILTDSSGSFMFELAYDFVYDVKFYKANYIYKIIRFDANNIPENDEYGGFEFPLVISLSTYLDGMDLSVFDQPIGVASFDSLRNSFEFDLNFTSGRKAIIENEFKRIEKIDLNNKIKGNRKFKKYMKKSEKMYKKGKFVSAIEWLKKSLILYPNTPFVTKRIEEIYSEM